MINNLKFVCRNKFFFLLKLNFNFASRYVNQLRIVYFVLNHGALLIVKRSQKRQTQMAYVHLNHVYE